MKENEFVNLIVLLYLDDMLVARSNGSMLMSFKLKMMEEFKMTDLGEMSFFLGIEFVQKSDGIFIHQTKLLNNYLRGLKRRIVKLLTHLWFLAANCAKMREVLWQMNQGIGVWLVVSYIYETLD